MTLAIIVIFAFLILSIIGLPISFSLLASTFIYFFGAVIPLNIIPIRMLRSYDSFVLLAIPFFIFMGKIMTEAKLSDSLVRLADLLVGRLKGGLAHVNIVVSMFFGGITGTAIADTTAIGSIMIPSMVKQGYSKKFSAAVTAASSTMGPIIPPSLMFIIYGSLAHVSIRDLFLAGAIPGIMIGLFQMAVVAMYSKKYDFPRRERKIQINEAIKIIKEASYALLLPVMIFGGITFGIVSPTEASIIGVFYSIFISVFIYKTLTIKNIVKIANESAIETGSVSIILASASLLGWILSNEQIPLKFAELLINSIAIKWQILLLINLFLFVMGMFMDSIPAIIIFTPVFIPLFKIIGVDPLHAGIFICVNLVTGLATPPVGCCLFAASVIAKEPMERVSVAILPFIFTNMIVTLLVTYIPQITLFLPSLIK